MKSNSLYIITIFCLFSIYGCKPLYIPNVINTPLFSNKNEVQASVHFGTAGVDPQLAYAVSNNIGIMVNASFSTSESEDTTNIFPHKHSFGELGLGYYTKLTDKQRFEVYGGYGIGTIKYELESNSITTQATGKTNRIFIQPAYGITTRNVDFSVASRFVIINGKDIDQKYSRTFWEPAATFRVGGPNLKFVTQVGLVMPFQDNYYFEYEPLLFSMGIIGHFNKIFE